jgi:hypothetical protein
LVAQRAALDGRVNVAQHVLESATEVASDPIDMGRVLADRARNSRKQGHIDLAEEQALDLLRRGRRIASSELIALAKNQLAAFAQVRGNLPEFRSLLEESVAEATRAGLRRLLASGYAGLGFHAARTGNHGDAVAHLWAAYQKSGGSGAIAMAALVNLSQTLLISGRPKESKKVSMLLLEQGPPIQSALPALGSYAIASARLSDNASVMWASSQVRHFAKSPHHAREVAEALLECGLALEMLGHGAQGGVLRRRAEAISVAQGFHDLTFSEAIPSSSGIVPARAPFTVEAERATAEIASIETLTPGTDARPVFT